MASRDSFLQSVRRAAQAGNRPGRVALEPRGAIGYQGAGTDPVAKLKAECEAAGGNVHVVSDREAAVAKVLELIQAKAARKLLLGRGQFIDSLNLTERLRPLGVEITAVDAVPTVGCREPFFAADMGISGVEHLIAETGTVVVASRASEPRSLSLLPPVHVAIAHRSQILPDLFDLFDLWKASPNGAESPVLPSCLTLITGPSKTGDIELRLVTGVHGPGEIHVIMMSD